MPDTLQNIADQWIVVIFFNHTSKITARQVVESVYSKNTVMIIRAYK